MVPNHLDHVQNLRILFVTTLSVSINNSTSVPVPHLPTTALPRPRSNQSPSLWREPILGAAFASRSYLIREETDLPLLVFLVHVELVDVLGLRRFTLIVKHRLHLLFLFVLHCFPKCKWNTADGKRIVIPTNRENRKGNEAATVR